MKIKLPGKNCLGYHAIVITGKYNTLDNIIIHRPMKDIWISFAFAVTTDNVINETNFVKTACVTAITRINKIFFIKNPRDKYLMQHPLISHSQ
jgi:hypothetical protein